MVWSIVGLELAAFGIPGLIICSIMKKNVAFYDNNGGEPCAFNKVAGILSKIGVILGIVMTVFWSVYCLVIFAACIAGGVHLINLPWDQIFAELESEFPGAIYG